MGHPTELIQFKMLFKWDKLCTESMSLPQATSSIQGSRQTTEMPRDAHKCEGQGEMLLPSQGGSKHSNGQKSHTGRNTGKKKEKKNIGFCKEG